VVIRRATVPAIKWAVNGGESEVAPSAVVTAAFSLVGGFTLWIDARKRLFARPHGLGTAGITITNRGSLGVVATVETLKERLECRAYHLDDVVTGVLTSMTDVFLFLIDGPVFGRCIRL